MSELASAEKLREGVLEFAPNIRRKVCMALDEIEREVSERFMELPVDADEHDCQYGEVKDADTREKLESDVMNYYTHTVSTALWPDSANKKTKYVNVSNDQVLGWLDRQKAITEREQAERIHQLEAERDKWMTHAETGFERIKELEAELRTHVKPRTVEDVLRDCCNEWNEHCGNDWESGVYAKYAAELRGMMEADE